MDDPHTYAAPRDLNVGDLHRLYDESTFMELLKADQSLRQQWEQYVEYRAAVSADGQSESEPGATSKAAGIAARSASAAPRAYAPVDDLTSPPPAKAQPPVAAQTQRPKVPADPLG